MLRLAAVALPVALAGCALDPPPSDPPKDCKREAEVASLADVSTEASYLLDNVGPFVWISLSTPDGWYELAGDQKLELFDARDQPIAVAKVGDDCKGVTYAASIPAGNDSLTLHLHDDHGFDERQTIVTDHVAAVHAVAAMHAGDIGTIALDHDVPAVPNAHERWKVYMKGSCIIPDAHEDVAYAKDPNATDVSSPSTGGLLALEIPATAVGVVPPQGCDVTATFSTHTYQDGPLTGHFFAGAYTDFTIHLEP